MGQESPPIRALLRMVQHLRYDPHLTNCDTLALVLLVRDSVLATESIKKELAFRCCEPLKLSNLKTYEMVAKS